MQHSFEELTQLSGGSPAKTTAWLESARDWMETGERSGGNFTVLSAKLALALSSGKTSPVFYPPVKDSASEPSSVAWSNSGIASAGGFWTFDTSESPKDGGECSLSQVLETEVAPKYSLSPKALISISNWQSQQNPLHHVLRREGAEICIRAHSSLRTER